MSRVAKSIDNGLMEGFWGILKRDRCYGKCFASKKELTDMIENFVRYYNTSVYSAASAYSRLWRSINFLGRLKTADSGRMPQHPTGICGSHSAPAL